MSTERIASITIRPLGNEDRQAVARLSGLDTSRVPPGRLLGAEVEGRLLAAVSLESGEVISDPFSRTSELRSLLSHRATQLGLRKRTPRRPRPVLRGRSRAGLSPTPPGAGGRLLSFPQRPIA